MNRREARALLSIAGSDPSGGAGIQADLKTFTALGAYGCAVITSLTVQNTLGVQSCHPLPPDLVFQQTAAVLADFAVSHVKIGMIGTTAIGTALCQALAGFTGEVIYDPVVFSSVGKPRQTTDSMDGIRQVAARATVLTPNRDELQILTGFDATTLTEAVAAAQGLFTSCPQLKAVVIKGGHLNQDQSEVTDTLLLAGEEQPLFRTHPRIISANTHGTGCTFAAALAAFHQKSGDYPDAFRRSVDFLDTLLALSAPYRLGQGTGGLCHHLYSHVTGNE